MDNTNFSSKKQLIINQYLKCKDDPVYFMKNYCYIINQKYGKIKFQLYPFQVKTLQDFHKNRYNIILKARQMGISTLTAGYALWLILFFSDKRVSIIANKLAVASNLFQKISLMYENLPLWLQTLIPYKSKNVTRMVMKNGSWVKAIPATKDAGRSQALSLLIIDQMAFVQQKLVRQIWGGSSYTLSTGGKAILLSTPNGVSNQFHQIWQKAQNGQNQFNTIKLHWYLHPQRDQKWRDQQNSLPNEKIARQQCDCEFLTSGGTVIDVDVLKIYKLHTKQPIKKLLKDSLWVWEVPLPNNSYIISADVARGDGGDYSAFHIFNMETMEQVAQFKGKIDTTKYGDLLVKFATYYNNALLVIQNNNIGWDTVKRAVQLQYQNLYYSYKHKMSVNKQKILEDMSLDRKEQIPGFTTSKNRSLLINKMIKAFRDGCIKINSVRLINQLYVFIQKPNGKAEAMTGKNDDLVMAMAIGLWIRDVLLQTGQQFVQITQATINGFFRTIDYDNNGYKQISQFESSQYKQFSGQSYRQMIKGWLR